VDGVTGVTDQLNNKTVPADKIFIGLGKIVEGLTFFEDAMILIYNIEKFISLENLEKIDLAVKKEKVRKSAVSQSKLPARKIPVKAGNAKDNNEKAEVRGEDQNEPQKSQGPKVVRAKRVTSSKKKKGL